MAKKEVSKNNKKKYAKFQKLPERLQVGIILFGEIAILLLAMTSVITIENIIENIIETRPVQRLSYNYQPSYYKAYKKAYNKFKNRTDLSPLAKERFMASYAVFYANQKLDQKLAKENKQYFNKINKSNQKFIRYIQRIQPINWSKHVKIPNDNTLDIDSFLEKGKDKPVKFTKVLCFDNKKVIWKDDKAFTNYLEKETDYNDNHVDSVKQLAKYAGESDQIQTEKTAWWLTQKLYNISQSKNNDLIVNNTDVANLYSLNKSFYFKPFENQSTNVPSTQLPYPFTNFHNYNLNVHTVIDKLSNWDQRVNSYFDGSVGVTRSIWNKHLNTLSAKHDYASPSDYNYAKKHWARPGTEYGPVAKFYIVNDPWYYNKYGYAPIDDDDISNDTPSKSLAQCVNHDIKIFNKNKTDGEPLSINKYDLRHSIVTHKTLKQAWNHSISYPMITLKTIDNEISQNNIGCLSPTDKMVNTNALLKRNYQNYQDFIINTIKEEKEKRNKLIPFWAYLDHNYLTNSANLSKNLSKNMQTSSQEKKTKKRQLKIIDTHKKTPIINWHFLNTTNVKHNTKLKKYHIQLGKMENYKLVYDTKPDCNYYLREANNRSLPNWMKNLSAIKRQPLQIGVTNRDELQIKNVTIEKILIGDYQRQQRTLIKFDVYMNWQNKSIPVIHFVDISRITKRTKA